MCKLSRHSAISATAWKNTTSVHASLAKAQSVLDNSFGIASFMVASAVVPRCFSTVGSTKQSVCPKHHAVLESKKEVAWCCMHCLICWECWSTSSPAMTGKIGKIGKIDILDMKSVKRQLLKRLRSSRSHPSLAALQNFTRHWPNSVEQRTPPSAPETGPWRWLEA